MKQIPFTTVLELEMNLILNGDYGPLQTKLVWVYFCLTIPVISVGGMSSLTLAHHYQRWWFLYVLNLILMQVNFMSNYKVT